MPSLRAETSPYTEDAASVLEQRLMQEKVTTTAVLMLWLHLYEKWEQGKERALMEPKIINVVRERQESK